MTGERGWGGDLRCKLLAKVQPIRRYRTLRAAALSPFSASVGGGAHRARAEAAGDPEWAAKGARIAVRSGQCRALRGRRPLRPVPAAPRSAASEAESREREGLSQPALWGGGGGGNSSRGPSRPLGLPSANACGEAPALPGRLLALPKSRFWGAAAPCRSGRTRGGYRSGALSFERNRNQGPSGEIT